METETSPGSKGTATPVSKSPTNPPKDPTTFAAFAARLFHPYPPASTLPPEGKQTIHKSPSKYYYDEWTIELLQWHSLRETTSTTTAKPGRKSKFKRPRDTNWPSLLQCRTKKRQAVGHDHSPDPEVVEYLKQHPTEAQARWSTIVQLSSGESVESFRFRQRSAYRNRYQSENPLEAWRNHFFSSFPVREGDFRGLVDEIEENVVRPKILLEAGDEGERIWRALLACGQEMVRQLEEKNSQRILLSELWYFIERATSLTPPDAVFTDAVFIEELSKTMESLQEFMDEARFYRAKLIDVWARESVDLEALRKFFDSVTCLPVKIDEEDELMRQLVVVEKWNTEVEAILTSDDLGNESDLQRLVALKEEIPFHGFRCKTSQSIGGKIDRAFILREQIEEWKDRCQGGEKSSLKVLGSMVKEAQKLKISFPQVKELLEFQEKAQTWVEKAMVATRTKSPLSVVKELLHVGRSLPVEVSEYIEKLSSRAEQADMWLEEFESALGAKVSVSLETSMMIRRELEGEKYSMLQALSTEGVRIPVDLELARLLQVEIDAKLWSAKASKWIPDRDKERRPGKYDDVEELLDDAESLRQRLVLVQSEKDAWVLEGENELRALINAADSWYDKYEDYMEIDRRRNQPANAPSLNLTKLRIMMDEADCIFLHLGTTQQKLLKIREFAETWFTKNKDVFSTTTASLGSNNVTFAAMREALDEANENIPIDMEEIIELRKKVKLLDEWRHKMDAICSGKKTGKFKASSFTLADCQKLIKEGSSLPVDLSCRVAEIEARLSEIEQWQSSISNDLKVACSHLEGLQRHLVAKYGSPKDFQLSSVELCPSGTDPAEIAKKTADTSQVGAKKSFADQTSDIIYDLLGKAEDSPILTPEYELSRMVEKVWKWCEKSLDYLENDRNIYDKRFFGALDRFVGEGMALAEEVTKRQYSPGRESGVIGDLIQIMTGFLNDQIVRVGVVRKERDEYAAWCEACRSVLTEDKKPAIEKLRQLSKRAIKFPVECELVGQLNELLGNAESWLSSASKFMDNVEKPAFNDLKGLLDEGEKIGVNSSELRQLKSACKSARAWQKKAQKCKVDKGKASASDIEELLDELNSLLVRFPEEEERLSKSVRNYCLCRRPYAGFMIGCDSCDDWFHGACVGVSESRAEKCETYQCVRCSLKLFHTSCASSVANLIKKWTCGEELERCRLLESQRHQRKVKKLVTVLAKANEERAKILCSISVGTESEGLIQPEDIPIDTASGTTEAVAGSQIFIPEASVDNSAVPTAIAPQNHSELVSPERIADLDKCIDKNRQSLKDMDEEEKSRSAIWKFEDSNISRIREWCLRVAHDIIAPPTHTQAEMSQPLPSGELSVPMVKLSLEARERGLDVFKDVGLIIKGFETMAWCFRAINLLSQEPLFEDIKILVSDARQLGIEDERAVKMLVRLHNRAVSWENKVMRALVPIPGEKKKISMTLLGDLSSQGEDIPLILPYEHRLQVVIEDKGTRHCICGGPSDGRFMLNCDSCDRWFHGRCVGLSKEASEKLEEWKCPICSNSDSINVDVTDFFDVVATDFDSEGGRSDGKTVVDGIKYKIAWPPFGLKGSVSAVEALGAESASFPHEVSSVPPTEENVESHVHLSRIPNEHSSRSLQVMTPNIENVGAFNPILNMHPIQQVGFRDAPSISQAHIGANCHLDRVSRP